MNVSLHTIDYNTITKTQLLFILFFFFTYIFKKLLLLSENLKYFIYYITKTHL